MKAHQVLFPLSLGAAMTLSPSWSSIVSFSRPPKEALILPLYDGVWACASILHVAKSHLPDIIRKIANATKSEGTVYMSFKYGDFEGVKNGRFFTYLTEKSFEELIEMIPELTVDKLWISSDVRVERGEERWLNIIMRKRA